MRTPTFQIGQEVHIARNHCSTCCKLESGLKHPIRVQAIQDYNDRGFAYRIQDASGVHYEVGEQCLCSDPAGHSSSPCLYCRQAA